MQQPPAPFTTFNAGSALASNLTSNKQALVDSNTFQQNGNFTATAKKVSFAEIEPAQNAYVTENPSLLQPTVSIGMIPTTQFVPNNSYSQLQQLPITTQQQAIPNTVPSNSTSTSTSTTSEGQQRPLYKDPAIQKLAKAGAVYAGTAVINTMLTGSPTTKVVSTKTVGKAADTVISLVKAVRGKKGEEKEGDGQQQQAATS